jgi:hypothetical protein
MVAPVQIRGTNNEIANVVDGGLAVSQIPAPSSSQDILTLPYVNFLTIAGDGQTTDLRVNGSLDSPVEAFIGAEAGADIYINTISVVITDSAASGGIYLNEFGAIVGGLTNGIVPFFQNKGDKLAFAERPLYTNFDFVRIGTLTPQVGQDQLAFRIQAERNSNDYAYAATWDMTRLSPYGLGLRLSAGTNQKLGIDVRDDITSLSGFEILATGYRRFV